MQRQQIDMILRGEPLTWLQPGEGRAIIKVDEQMKNCCRAVAKLVSVPTKTARPLMLSSSQLPPIF
jgi:hypothetical protein